MNDTRGEPRALSRHWSERRWEGLNVPQKQPKTRRLWLNPLGTSRHDALPGVDGSHLQLRSGHRDHVWSYDDCRTDGGTAFGTPTILDAFTRECPAIRAKRKLNSIEVIDALSDLVLLRGVPAFIRSDTGPEFAAETVKKW